MGRYGYDGVACGNNKCGRGNCSDCDGNNYPAISSAFSSVPDNFNSVTNFVPKFAVYRAVRVMGKATENIANECSTSHCYEKGDDHWRDNRGCCDANSELGFIDFPRRLRTVEVEVCGKVRCNNDSKGFNRDVDFENGENCGRGCGSSVCGPALLGFANYPQFATFRDIRTCGPIVQKAACKKHGINGCRKCKTIKNCHGACSSSSGSSSSGHSNKRHGSRHHRRSHNGGCGC